MRPVKAVMTSVLVAIISIVVCSSFRMDITGIQRRSTLLGRSSIGVGSSSSSAACDSYSQRGARDRKRGLSVRMDIDYPEASPVKQIPDYNQRQAITTRDSAVMIVAGPGSGKTRVMSARLAYLLESGLAKPSEILVLSFTNTAANNLCTGADKLLRDAESVAITRGVTCETFHGFCRYVYKLEEGVIESGYYSILVVSCFMWSGALDTFDCSSIISFNVTSITHDQYTDICSQTFIFILLQLGHASTPPSHQAEPRHGIPSHTSHTSQ